jgi:hypothetical protein
MPTRLGDTDLPRWMANWEAAVEQLANLPWSRGRTGECSGCHARTLVRWIGDMEWCRPCAAQRYPVHTATIACER